MSGRPAPQAPDACKRASALAQLLGRELEQLRGKQISAAAGRTQTRATLARLDALLSIGLGFDVASDAELTYRRGHARNVALVLRRTVEAALTTSVSGAGRNELLLQAIRFADELTGTITWIRHRVLELPAAPAARPWNSTWAGRLLGVAARLLPAEQRQDFIEDQCGNLAGVASRREWAGYLLGLMTQMPRIAAAAVVGNPER